ncbi:peroxisomal biogenesis factor 3-like [Asterias amurensis]|uniref:peroxisomal biogenesis factor 3-like n=1 Tax=Asterias amurensis TaxID=7602 RepID=UPI003AB49EE4
MLESLKNFVRRHKKKFVVLGVVTGGAVLLWKYGEWKLQQWQDKETDECLVMARRQHHFDSNQRTCNMTVLSMLPKTKEALSLLLDSDGIIQMLKAKPENKVDLWNDLKIISFSRTIASVYSTAMLVVFLRVQLNIIGGYMYLDTLLGKNEMSEERILATPDVQKRYLANVQYLLTDGMSCMVSAVREAVENVLGSMPLQKTLGLRDIERLFSSVRCQVEAAKLGEQGSGMECTIHPLVRYMVPVEEDEDQGEDTACQISSDQLTVNGKLMLETRDMLESSDFHSVLNTCLDIGFSRVLDNMADFFRPSSDFSAETAPTTGLIDAHLPLAKIIPVINGQINALCGETPNPYIQELLLMKCVKDFAANVYEAFSQLPPDPTHDP